MSGYTIQYLEQRWSIEYEDGPGVSTALVAQIIAVTDPEQLAAAIAAYLAENPPDGAALSDVNPEPLGVADPGTAEEASRSDHVHPLPSPADIGAAADDDSRLSDSRTPTGGAGGVLGGSYPNPSFAVNMAEQSELDSHTNATTSAHGGIVAASDVGAPDGVAELDSGGKVPSSQLPSYVDDVVTATNFAALPGTGETGKIYIVEDTNVTYRWSGSAYVEISASLALGETSSTAYRGDRGKTAYDHSQMTGNPHGTTAADVGADPAGSASTAQANAVQRSNHTGTQAISTVSGLQTALDGKSATGHGHATSDVTGLDAALAAKAPATRTVGTGLGTSGTVDLDMASLHGSIQAITLTGSTTFTTSARAAGREVTLVLAAGGSSRTLAWPSWTAVGAALPTTLGSGKTLVVTVTFTGSTEASGIAAAAAQP